MSIGSSAAAAPSWVAYLGLCFSGVAAVGGVGAAIITARLHRRNADAAWERDRVTEHYLELLQSAYAVSNVYAHEVTAIYESTPVGDVDHAWALLSQAHSEFFGKSLLTSVVARRATRQALSDLLDVDIFVLAPLAAANGMPSIAFDRAQNEELVLARRLAALVVAMRVDLGLSKPGDLPTTSLPSTREQRSAAAPSDPALLRTTLRQYGVRPLRGATDEFRIDPTAMSAFQLSMPALRQPLGALMVINGPAAITAGIASDVGPDEEITLLKNLVRFVESGLRDGPGQRDSPTGGRVASWPRGS